MSKIDIESAYRCIPVRPADWPLLGLQWDDKVYFDTVMQFGITSATAIFEWYSSAAQYIAQHTCAIQHMVHYVDDFMLFMHGLDAAKTIASPTPSSYSLSSASPCPCTSWKDPHFMVFLGILFDSVAMTFVSMMRSLQPFHAELTAWNERKTASREELQSFIGVLSFAAKVVAPGRTFLRRMIDHLKTLPSNTATTTQHPLSASFRADLNWWRHFLSKWNGIAIVPDVNWSPAHVLDIYTDACVEGYGAMYGPHWFACSWTVDEEQQAARNKRDSMPFKELYALTSAAATWGSQWSGRKILFHCDCLPIVDAWRRGDSKQPHISNLIRTLLFIAATHDFNLNSHTLLVLITCVLICCRVDRCSVFWSPPVCTTLRQPPLRHYQS